MWTKSYSTITTEVSPNQLWELFANVNQWPTWDSAIEATHLEGDFKQGNFFTLKPKGGPRVKIELLEVNEPLSFTDVTYFPGAKMYDRHEFEPTEHGLKITNTISVTGILSFVWIKLVAKNIANSLPDDIARQIKAAKLL